MDEEGLISTLSTEFDSQLATPVRTTGFEDERPVPVVIIDDWTTDDIHEHNSPFAHEEIVDGVYTRWYRFYFETRVEFLVRHSDEVAATSLKGDVKNILREWVIDAQSFHDDINEVTLRGSGDPQHTFREPRETEQHVTAVFEGIFDIVKDDYDTLDNIRTVFTY